MLNSILNTNLITLENAENCYKDLMKELAAKDYEDLHYMNAYRCCRMKWGVIAKPLNSLGIFENDIARLSKLTGNSDIDISKRALVIFCSDNGIVEEGVTQTGSDVTTSVVRNITFGKSCSHLMSEIAGLKIIPVDIGMIKDPETGTVNELVKIKIRRGTRNFLREPAMTLDETYLAILKGFWLVENLKKSGYKALAVGEMGIGNTSTSAAIASVLLNVDPAVVTGKGAGLSNSGLQHKIEVIREGIALRKPDKKNAIDILHKLGGYDLAGMVGLFLGGAYYDMPIVLDGVITMAAAALAYKLFPKTRRCMFASHVTKEPACQKLLKYIDLNAPVNAGLSLGEGTGAATLFPLWDMAVNVYMNMMTFEEMDIEAYKPL